MSDLVYVLDANVFIEAARRYYAFDLAPKFWDSLIEQVDCGVIESIDRVKNWTREKTNLRTGSKVTSTGPSAQRMMQTSFSVIPSLRPGSKAKISLLTLPRQTLPAEQMVGW